MTAAAWRLIRSDTGAHLAALTTLVAKYIREPEAPAAVDWEFIVIRYMRPAAFWKQQDKARHLRALAALHAAGHAVAPSAER